MSIEEFENYILVDAKVITSKVLTPEDIIAEISAKQDKKNIYESDDDKDDCEEFLTEPLLTYSIAFE